MTLEGVRVEITHIPNKRRHYKITAITRESVANLRFTLRDGSEIFVDDYFKQKYPNACIDFSLPCINAGSDNKPIYLPIQVCQIVEGQKYFKKLNIDQVQKRLDLIGHTPFHREQNILKIVKTNNYNLDMYAYAFDISVEPELVECEARVLPAPRRILVGAIVDAWACINFSELGVDIVQNFCNELVVKCNSIGMVFNKTPVISIHSQNPEQIENSLRQLHSQSIEILLKKQNQKHKQLQLLIVVLPDLEGSYGRIKTICETELGLVTQCCKKTHLSSMPIKNPYKQNLALKINVKVAGRNTALQDTNRIPPMFAAPSIIFGADVTHPSPGKNSSSISAVVASMDWPHHTKYRALVSAQPSGQDKKL